MTRHNNKRGFNLIEAAIVLGVVGLVVGGIWTAASAVSDKIRWNQTERGWRLIVMEVMKELNYDTVLRLGNSFDATNWFRESIPVQEGWTTSQGGHGLTYRMHDPEGYGITVATGLYGGKPEIIIGYISPMYGSPSGTLPKRHCARAYSLLKNMGSTYTILRWGSLPSGCSPWALNGFDSFYNSTCCPGRPLVSYAAQ